ncbi:hypothetical protein GON03_15300 [Nocardioides sp. MAH-18]|uniref:Uncharacterized protein n=1 Tax=Nocardioides agri TaxID=2682843 RepID=A0A6L6XUV5_9ACTN|nr:MULTISPECIES: hypothetical protein [unclassified Nocardioides]MBA2955702.1 hypothetical protein [Nocardioides sp. CGMCC 1.13656]MVQ50552.1 hypothetical protein [Nocardioides sp. MAH-18]
MSWDGRAFGSSVGVVGGEVFVQLGAGGLPGEAIIRTVGVVAGLAVLATIVRYARSDAEPPPPPSPAAVRWYGVCVLAMVAAIPLGSAVLRAADRAELVPIWVVTVVGAHFAPFARLFGQPVFARLSGALVAVGLLGGALTLAGLADGPGWTLVAAGAVLLWFAHLPRR